MVERTPRGRSSRRVVCQGFRSCVVEDVMAGVDSGLGGVLVQAVVAPVVR